MTFRRFILFFVLAIAALAAQAQASFSLVRPQNVVQGRNFALTFRLSNGEASAPAAPQLKGCTLLYGPALSTRSEYSIVNGRATSSTTLDFSFTYRADTPGTVDVPAVSVNCGGKTLHSSAARFEILPGDASASGGSSQQGASRRQQDPYAGSQPTEKVSANDLLIRINFSKSSVYEQEPVVATIKLYTKYGITSFLPSVQPAFDGFLCEELPVSNEVSLEHYNGQNYHTVVFKRLLLYPQKSGRLTVNSGEYKVTVEQVQMINMGFFSAPHSVEQELTTKSNAASLTVKPLPEPRPAGFSGAVGQFSVSTALEPELLRTNEAAVYSYTVKGTGNIKYLAEPDVQFPAGIDAYTPKTDIQANVTGGSNMSGTYRTDFTIVPQEMGDFTIEGTPFIYFDPSDNKYVTVDVPSKPIKVLRGTNAAPAVEQTALSGKTIDDILYIKPMSDERQTHSRTFVIRSWGYWGAYVLLVLILIAVAVIYRRQIRLRADVTGRKLAKAGRVANKRLREARTAMNAHNNELFYASLAKALWGYLSDKLSISASQLTLDNVADKLKAYGLPEADTDHVIDVLNQCEMARFTPTHSDAEIAGLYDEAVAAIKNIEDVRKR